MDHMLHGVTELDTTEQLSLSLLLLSRTQCKTSAPVCFLVITEPPQLPLMVQK